MYPKVHYRPGSKGKPRCLSGQHLNNSRAQRRLWLLEEIGADYEIRYYDLDPVTNVAPPELRAVQPLGKSPLIEESGDSASGGRGRVIIESGAITEYL